MLNEYGELIKLKEKVSTVREAAHAVGVSQSHIVKTIVVVCGGSPLAIVVRGDKRLNLGKFGERLGCEDVRLATPDEVKTFTGYDVGGVPPVLPIDTYVDSDVLRKDYVYGGGGDEHTLLKFSPRDLARRLSWKVVEI